MRLLFDQNLSPRLVARLADLFPESAHVASLGLNSVSDKELLSSARDSGHTLVTKDADLADLITLTGPPPKIIWIRVGNCTTAEIEDLLRLHYEALLTLEEDPIASILSLC